MAIRRSAKKNQPIRRATPSRYTPGTRLAESYGMDLDREKREGRSADGIGRRTESLGTTPGTPAHARIAWMLGLPAIGFVLLAIVLLQGRSRQERPIASYDQVRSMQFGSVMEAVRAGGFKEGWLPLCVPEGATSIMIHRDRARRIWVSSFLCPDGEVNTVIQRLAPIPRSDWNRVLPDQAHAKWWPAELVRGSDRDLAGWDVRWTGQLFKSGYEYRARERHSQRIYVWLGPTPFPGKP